MSGDDSSSSDEDIPLSALGKKAKVESSDEEAEFNDADDDDEEMGDEPDSDSDDFIDDDDEDEDDDDDGAYASDSSDDVPLSALRSPQKKVKAKAGTKKKASSSPTKKAAPKKKSTTTKSKSSSSSSSAKKKAKSTSSSSSKKSKASSSTSSSSAGSGGSNYLCASNELYSHCDKGKLIQSLLSRWWHAYQWPDPKILMEPTPRGYDALDGFPGVYICTQGSNVGKFIDRRNHEQSPSFRNFARKSSEELKELLLAAIDKQMKELIQHEGEGTETEKNLKVLSKWANKLNCTKADKEAEKVLKAKRLVLP